MENLNNAVQDYLTKQTNYAILIKGDWGIGKTYYYKNVISKTIEKTPTSNDRINFKPIHISLFGLKSVEDIQAQIFLEIFPILKGKAVKLSSSLVKLFARGIFTLKGFGDIDKYISDIKPNKGELIDFSQLVLCFDDLERKSPKLQTKELIGFINTLIENNDAKILLIANEDKITHPAYNDYKEKIIGITIEFIPDTKAQLEEIIKNRYAIGYSEYSNFLKDEAISHLVRSLFAAVNNNLRLLIFALDKLHTIYSTIRISILDIPEKKDSIVRKKLHEITRFTLSISFEFKKNNISYKNRDGLDKNNAVAMKAEDIAALIKIKDSPLGKTEKTYKDNFIEKYYGMEDFKFFESIYSFITGADTFKVNQLESEIEKAFHVVENKILPQYETINKLDYRRYFMLSDKEYRKLTRQMVEYAKKGMYEMPYYITVLHYVARFNNMLNYDIPKLKESLIRGMKRGEPQYSFDPTLDFHFQIPQGTPEGPLFEELHKYASEINTRLRQKEEKAKSIKLLNLIESDITKFINTILDDGNGRAQKYYYSPVFSFASSHKIFLTLNKISPLELNRFLGMIRHRYKHHPELSLKHEIDFWKALNEKLSPKTKVRKQKNIKNHLLNEINEEITNVIAVLNQLSKI